MLCPPEPDFEETLRGKSWVHRQHQSHSTKPIHIIKKYKIPLQTRLQWTRKSWKKWGKNWTRDILLRISLASSEAVGCSTALSFSSTEPGESFSLSTSLSIITHLLSISSLSAPLQDTAASSNLWILFLTLLKLRAPCKSDEEKMYL